METDLNQDYDVSTVDDGPTVATTKEEIVSLVKVIRERGESALASKKDVSPDEWEAMVKGLEVEPLSMNIKGAEQSPVQRAIARGQEEPEEEQVIQEYMEELFPALATVFRVHMMGMDALPLAHIPGRMQQEIKGLEVMQLKPGERMKTDELEKLPNEEYMTVMDVQLKKDCRVTDWSGAFEQWRKNNSLNDQVQMKEKYIVNKDFSEEKLLAVQHFQRQGVTVRIRLCTQFKFHAFLTLTGEQSGSKSEYDDMMEKWVSRVQVHMSFKADLRPEVMAPP
eukprot:scaffold248353_cov71-Cyclotella_meneghiniana.AAC.4